MKVQLWIVIALLALIVLKLYASWIVIAVQFVKANLEIILPVAIATMTYTLHILRRIRSTS